MLTPSVLTLYFTKHQLGLNDFISFVAFCMQAARIHKLICPREGLKLNLFMVADLCY